MTHTVLGYPSVEESIKRIQIMVDAGVDIIEVQIPFSDPVADGPVITEANEVALTNGVTVPDCFTIISELTKKIEIPLQWVGYYNTILQYGIDNFIQDSLAAGIQGFTFPDIPIDEEPYEGFFAATKKAGIPAIQLVSPLTPEKRLEELAEYASSLVYCVARFGTTGRKTDISNELNKYITRVRKYIDLPLAVGFGISEPKHITVLKDIADVAVVGSALLKTPTSKLKQATKALCAAR